jgi:hypothetical protein
METQTDAITECIRLVAKHLPAIGPVAPKDATEQLRVLLETNSQLQTYVTELESLILTIVSGGNPDSEQEKLLYKLNPGEGT